MNPKLARIITYTSTAIVAIGALFLFVWHFCLGSDSKIYSGFIVVIVSAILTYATYRVLVWTIPVSCPKCAGTMKYVFHIRRRVSEQDWRKLKFNFQDYHGYICEKCAHEDLVEYIDPDTG